MNKNLTLKNLSFVIHPRPLQMSGIQLALVICHLVLVGVSCCGYSTRSLLPSYMQKVHIKLFENQEQRRYRN
jgi:hypothetical protein